MTGSAPGAGLVAAGVCGVGAWAVAMVAGVRRARVAAGAGPAGAV